MGECKNCANMDNEYCFACDDGNQFKPMTNADRIRSMTDEELARTLFDVSWAAWRNSSNGEGIWTEQDWLDWLKKECAE